MKALYLLTLSILMFGLSANAQQKVAIYLKLNRYSDYKANELKSFLINDLLSTDQYIPIERDNEFLAAIEKETDFQTSGEVPDEMIAGIGRKFGAQIVISGNYRFNRLSNNLFCMEANLRAIDIESGRIISSVSETEYNKFTFNQEVSKKLVGSLPVNYSTTPKHLSLCVTKDGKRFYIKPSQWETMSERKKEDYNIRGICIMTDGEAFIMSLRDSGKGDWDYAKANNVLSLTQMQLIGSLKHEINKSLEIFGGNLPKPRSEEFYWTSSEIDSGKAWGITTNNESKKYKKKTSGLIRKGWNL